MNEHCSVHDERCASTASQVWFLNARGRSAGAGAAARWEVKTIRRKLRELAGRAKAAFLHRLLARRRAAQDEEALAYLYIDGHVRAYSGKRKIGKAYVTTRKSVMPAETDYWVNLTNGQPLLVVHAHANERLTQILCNRFDIDPVELAYRMFGRWKQENWFKYMDEPFALDVLADDGTEPDDPDRLVVNPAWRKLDKAVRRLVRSFRRQKRLTAG